MVVCSPVARFSSASLFWTGVLSLRMRSACVSEYPMLDASQCESDEKACCAPKAIVLVVPAAMLVTRSSSLPFWRLIP